MMYHRFDLEERQRPKRELFVENARAMFRLVLVAGLLWLIVILAGVM